VQFALTAHQLEKTNDVRSLEILAAAYAQSGRFEEAIESVQEAIRLAERDGKKETAATDQKLLQLFQTSQAYTEETPRLSLFLHEQGE